MVAGAEPLLRLSFFVLVMLAATAEARGVSPYLPVNISPEIERKIERDHIHFARLRNINRFGQLDFPPAAAAFSGLMLSGMVDQDGADHMRRQPEKLRAILEMNVALSQEAQIDLVNNGCGLQAVMRPPATQIAGRHTAQLVVD